MRLNRYAVLLLNVNTTQIHTKLVLFYSSCLSSRFMTKLDAEGMEAKLDSRVPLSGQEYREILQKMNDLLIDTNAHLESGNRHYNYLFEKTLCVNFNSIVYKQYDKLVCNILPKIRHAI